MNTNKDKSKWYRVVFDESFYDDMVGKLIISKDKTVTLWFGNGLGSSIFYKEQVQFEGEY